jgi:hypothetical protein
LSGAVVASHDERHRCPNDRAEDHGAEPEAKDRDEGEAAKQGPDCGQTDTAADSDQRGADAKRSGGCG